MVSLTCKLKGLSNYQLHRQQQTTYVRPVKVSNEQGCERLSLNLGLHLKDEMSL